MPWEKITDFKSQVKVGDKLRDIYNGPHIVTVIGEKYYLLQSESFVEEQVDLQVDPCRPKLREIYRKPERWTPKQGEQYWYVTSKGYADESTRCWDSTDYFDNCFRTEAQAEEAAKRVRKTIHDYQEELMEEGEE